MNCKGKKYLFCLITFLLVLVFSLNANPSASKVQKVQKIQKVSKVKSSDGMLTVQAMEDGLHITKRHKVMFTHVDIHISGSEGENYSISTNEKTNSFVYPFVKAGNDYSVYLTMMDSSWGNWTQSKKAVVTANGGLGDVKSKFSEYSYDNDSMTIILKDYELIKPDEISLLAQNFCGNIYYNQKSEKINWKQCVWGNYPFNDGIVDISGKCADFANTNFFVQLESKFFYNGINYHSTLVSNEKNMFHDIHPLKNVSLSSGILIPPFNPGIKDYKISGTQKKVILTPEFYDDVDVKITKKICTVGNEDDGCDSSDSIDFSVDGIDYSYNFNFEKTESFSFDGKKYTQTFYDDFNGTELNPSNWKKCSEEERQATMKGHGWWSNECSYLDGKGNLVIEAKYKNGQNLSGAIESEGIFEQSHGFYEIKFKCENTTGLWYAFWLMGDNDEAHVGKGATDAAEIDIFELVPNEPYGNGPNYFKTTINWDAYGKSHKAASSPAYNPDNSFYNQWHTAQFVWGEKSYKLFLDGKLLYEMDASVTNDKHYGGMCNGTNYMIISSEFGDWGGPFDEKQLPARMLVDYVKAGI